MWDLFKSEFVRFRRWAFALSAVHLMALGFMARVVDLAQQPLVVHWVVGSTYALAGLLLGLYQMGSYRKPSQWLNLLHRPLPHRRVLAALAIAAAVLLVISVAVPIALVATWQETMTPRVVDLRHWLLPLSGWLVAACAYLAGAFSSLRGVRWAGAALVLLMWLIASRAYGPGLIGVELIALGWLATMLCIAFTPDLTAPPRSAVATAVVALPLSMAAYLMLLLVFMCAEMLWVAQGSHPNNTPTPPPGGHNEVEKMDERDRMLAALRGSRHADAALLREQVRLSEPQGIGLQVPKLPQHNELANFRPMEFDDGEHGIRWVFSHDDMRLHGYHLSDKRSVGALGVEGQHPFPAVVLPLPGSGLPGLADGDVVLVGGRTLYQYVSETRQVLPRLQVPAGETLFGGSDVGGTLAALSDRALYFYDGRALEEETGVVPHRLRVPAPGRMGDLRSLELIELVDGYLVSFTYSTRSYRADGVAPYQVVLRVRDDGRTEQINRRALAYDYPAVDRYRSWWPSPVLYAAHEAALDLFAPPLPLDVTDPAPVPRSMQWLAFALAAASLLLAAWRVSRSGLPRWPRVAWVLASALLGPPLLYVVWVMVPVREPVPQTVEPAHVSPAMA